MVRGCVWDKSRYILSLQFTCVTVKLMYFPELTVRVCLAYPALHYFGAIVRVIYLRFVSQKFWAFACIPE